MRYWRIKFENGEMIDIARKNFPSRKAKALTWSGSGKATIYPLYDLDFHVYIAKQKELAK